MDKNSLEELCCTGIRLVNETGDFIRQELGKVRRGDVEEKSLNSLVSYVDKEAEGKLVEGFAALLPGSVFLTEEETVRQGEGTYRWIIDPLDGTTNFLHQLPCFAISVALQEKGRTILGIVFEINRKECFYAWDNGGAYCNGRRLQVRETGSLKDSLIATGFPYHDYRMLESYFRTLDYYMRHTRGIRRFGSAAVDLAYVASGRFDGFFEYSLNPWDVAAGAFLVEQAGGKVTDFSGGSDYLFGKEIVAAATGIHEPFLRPIREHFKGQH